MSRSNFPADDKNVRISLDTHKRLLNYVVNNPILKINRIADVGVSQLLDKLEETNDYTLLQTKRDEEDGIA
jgi:hypothetical protein